MTKLDEIILATPEQLALGEKLTEILMPYATDRRKILRERNGRFVHYTSAAAGLNIIKAKTLWVRSTTAMSDYSEVQHGNITLGNHPSLKPLLEFMDAELNGVGSEARTLFQQWWSDIQLQTFLGSISEHDPSEDQHGRLSMWRAFARTTARVAIVFRLPFTPGFAQPLRLLLSPVAYFTTEELAAELKSVQDSIKNNLDFLRATDRAVVVGFAFFMLMLGVVCLKHEGFKEEREWRIIYSPKRMESPVISSAIEVIDGVPQTVYKVPLDGGGQRGLEALDFPKIFDRVIIGPSQYPWVMKEAFIEVLKSAEIADADQRVFISGIPIRT